MAKFWLNGKWLDLANQRWAEWDADKEDTSAFWKEKIPNIHELEKKTIDEVVTIVAGVLYPDKPIDFREHQEIAELYKVLTHFRTMRYNLGTFQIGPQVRGLDVPGYENQLWYNWDEVFHYEDWDWEVNDVRDDKYSNALNRVDETNGPITRRKNFYGASFDEYPLFIAAGKNAEKAVLASFVMEDFKKEELIARAKVYVEGLEAKNKKEEMYRWVIDDIADDDFISSLADEQIVKLMTWVSTNRYSATRFIDNMNSSTIWELYKNKEVFMEMVKLARIKKIMGS